MEILKDIEIDLNRDLVLDSPPLSKWIKSEKTRGKLEKLLDKWGKRIEQRLSVKAVYNVLKKEETDIEQYSPPDPILEVEYLAMGIVTIGNLIEEGNEESEFSLEKIVIDTLENVALDQSVRKVVESIREKAEADGLKLSRVISPGSGRINWGIENQEFICKNLKPEMIGVSLTSNYALNPPKSVSFLIGLGKNLETPENLFSCEGCERLDCPYRVE